jgi:hypothetical protein
MTIRDYLARLEPSKDRSRGLKTTSIRPDAASDPFSRLLTTSLLSNNRNTNSSAKGLTAVDYLTNSIPAIRYGQRTVCSNSPSSAGVEAKTAGAQEFSAQHSQPPGATKDPASHTVQSAAAHARTRRDRMPEHCDAVAAQTIDRCIRKAAAKYDLSPDMIRAVVKAESNFKVDAVSVAGAQGLMQLMPATAKELGVKNPFDIRQNIDGGTRYLRQMLDLFGGDIRMALSAYNAGPGNVTKYGGDVPFPETRRYVSRILNAVGQTV